MGVVACFIVYTSRGICTLFFLWSRNLQRKIFDLRTQAKIGFERGAGRAKASAAAESLSPSAHCASRSQTARLFIDDLWSVVIYHYK